MSDTSPILMYAATVAAAVALMAIIVRTRPMDRKRSPGMWIRRVALLVAVAALPVLLAYGLVRGSIIPYALFLALVVLYAGSDSLHTELGLWLENQDPVRARALLVGFAVLCGFLALELPSNPFFFPMFTHQGVYVELLVIALFVVFCWLVGQRRQPALVVPVALLFLVGVAEYFVAFFKQMPILPSDIMALSTAAAVSGGYTYAISGSVLLGLAAVVACARVTSAIGWDRPLSRRPVAQNLGLAAASALALVLGFTQVSFVDTLGIKVRAWCPLDDYQAFGFIPSFASGVQAIFVTPPEGYTTEGAEELVASYAQAWDEGEGASERRQAAEAQFAETRPNVIVVMNETFADISQFGGCGVGYEGPQFFQNVDGLMKGTLYVSAYGGGTCNTEFEFLTGQTLAYLGQSVYPYTLYNLEGVEALPQLFREMGYGTTAMHPNLATNWNRDVVYQTLGFERFLTLDDFEGADTLRGLVSDAATYDACLDIIRESDEPQFVFDVTMQNHSGYKTGKMPGELMTDYRPEGVDEEGVLELNEYVSLIEQSDIALEQLLAQLEELDEPTVVIFFGDHQAYFADNYNNRFMQDDNELDHTMRIWATSYLVWANYDVAGAEELDADADLSTNFLGAVTLDAIGAPLSDLQKAELSLHEYLQAVNIIGYEDHTGSFQWGDAGDVDYDYYAQLEQIQYRYFFDYEREGGLWVMSTAPGVTNPNDEEW